jgi:biopolymer transport protein TolQ
MESLPLATTGSELSVWALFWQAGWVVKLVMLGLLAASVWTWAIVFDKIIAFRRMRASLERFEQVFWSGQSLEELYRTLSDRKTTGMGAIFVAAMREWKKSFEKGARSPLGVADAHRQGDGPSAHPRDGEAGRPARLPRHHRFGGSLHRPVRHGGRHHDLVPGDRRLEVDQSGSGGARHRGSAAGHGDRPLAAIPAVIAYNKLTSDAGKLAVRMEGFADEFSAILSRQIDEKVAPRRPLKSGLAQWECPQALPVAGAEAEATGGAAGITAWYRRSTSRRSSTSCWCC